MKFKKYINEGFADDKNFTSDVEILRLAIQAELDAINLYEQLATKTKNKNIKTILLDVAFEEKVHVEEFNKLLEDIDPDYSQAEDDAEDELADKLE